MHWCVHHKSSGALLFAPERCVNVIVPFTALHNICIQNKIPLNLKGDNVDIGNEDNEQFGGPGKEEGRVIRVQLVANAFGE